MTQRPGKLYLHVLKWNADGIRTPGLLSEVSKAYLLASPSKALETSVDTGELIVRTPTLAPDENVSVIVLEIERLARVDATIAGERHWNIGTGIRLNEEKIAAQRAKGWI